MEKQHSFQYHEFERLEDLEASDLSLLMEARKALQSSYSPYSTYKVGAAVRLADGSVFTGSNQENEAFPSSLCAERVAIFSAASARPGIPFEAIAITARSDNFKVNKPVTPCGACRQVMIEYETLGNRPFRVIMAGETGNILVTGSVDHLLPFSFHEEELQQSTKKM